MSLPTTRQQDDVQLPATRALELLRFQQQFAFVRRIQPNRDGHQTKVSRESSELDFPLIEWCDDDYGEEDEYYGIEPYVPLPAQGHLEHLPNAGLLRSKALPNGLMILGSSEQAVPPSIEEEPTSNVSSHSSPCCPDQPQQSIASLIPTLHLQSSCAPDT